MGDLLRAEAENPPDGQEGIDIHAIMRNGSLVPHTRVHDVLQRCLIRHLQNGQSKFLIDGFPRSLEQAQYFERHVSARAPVKVRFRGVLQR